MAWNVIVPNNTCISCHFFLPLLYKSRLLKKDILNFEVLWTWENMFNKLKIFSYINNCFVTLTNIVWICFAFTFYQFEKSLFHLTQRTAAARVSIKATCKAAPTDLVKSSVYRAIGTEFSTSPLHGSHCFHYYTQQVSIIYAFLYITAKQRGLWRLLTLKQCMLGSLLILIMFL